MSGARTQPEHIAQDPRAFRVSGRLHGTIVAAVAVWLAGVGTIAALGAAPRGQATAPGAGRGPIVNIAADGLVGCLVPPLAIDGSHGRDELLTAYRKLVDHYADAGVPYLFLNVCYQRAAYPSKVWDTYWDLDDPDTQATGWPRCYWLLHKKGVDPFAACIARCRARGVLPWLSIRMNDTHYIGDPTRTSSFWQRHPELRRAPQGGYDFTHQAVRDHYLALVAEVMDRYDCDGVELDWMRFPWHFKPGEERRGRAALDDFMRAAHELAEQASRRRGHVVRLAARIPAVPEFAQGLGMDGVAWARNGWVDMLILASVWRPSDTDIPIERWRALLGPAAGNVLLAAGTDLWLQGAPGGKLMSDDRETQRAFTAAMLDRGADLIYLFNHFNMNDFRYQEPLPDGRTVVRDEGSALLAEAGRLEAAVQGARRHVLTFHDPAPPGLPNPKPLPAQLALGRPVRFRLFIGPKPTKGRVILRVGLERAPGVAEARLGARLNGAACGPLEDLTGPAPRKPNPHDASRVFHVAHVAHRMVQFEAPLGAARRGYNEVALRLVHGAPQKVVWLEIYLTFETRRQAS